MRTSNSGLLMPLLSQLKLFALLFPVLCFPVLCFPVLCFAEVRIGTVEMSRILNEAPEAKKGLKTIEKMRENAEKELKSELSDLKPKLEKLKSDSGMSNEARARLQQDRKNLARLEEDKKEEINRKLSELRRDVMRKSLTAIKKVAEEKNIDLVLYKSPTGAERGVVLYGSERFDVTDAVIEKLSE